MAWAVLVRGGELLAAEQEPFALDGLPSPRPFSRRSTRRSSLGLWQRLREPLRADDGTGRDLRRRVFGTNRPWDCRHERRRPRRRFVGRRRFRLLRANRRHGGSIRPAMRGVHSTIGRRQCPARRSAVLHRQASPTRPESLHPLPRMPAAACRTCSVRLERTVAAFLLKAWSGTAGVRTTSASPTRIVDRRRPVRAVARPPTTAQTSASEVAIASWTRTAVRAGTVRRRSIYPSFQNRRVAIFRSPISATRPWTLARTTRTALRSTRG